jgi:SOS-response transcriptional repressor LexA
MDFSKLLIEQREATGMSQSELSRLSGLAQTTISGYELGVRRPKIENIVKIANALSIPVERFLATELAASQNHETLLPVKEPAPSRIRRVPDLGWAGAGLRIDPMQDTSEFVEAVGLGTGNVVSFRVRGNSMAGHMIGDGHRVYVRISPAPENGEIVVVAVEGQYRLKVFRVKAGKTWLYSSDGSTPPLDMSQWQPEDIEMVGVLVKTEWVADGPRKRK